MYNECRIAQLFLFMLKIIYIHEKKVFSSIRYAENYQWKQHDPHYWKLPMKTAWSTLLEINYASEVTKNTTDRNYYKKEWLMLLSRVVAHIAIIWGFIKE
jgi:hypothetical protein